ncbi:hypothetical protein AB0J80_18560 [Actinoplanes sp. NPDC049548]|uniref:hypothetical protein n=1 Tax=Actinoplanes sp. NPDC049548 TaxID=3155152 RepID=UPI00342DDAE9
MTVLALAGCSGGGPVPVAASPAPSPASSAVADDPPGALACGRIVEAVRAGTLMQPGVVTGVSASTATADAPVADAAVRLQQAYEQAVKAQGSEDEPDLVAAVSAAAAEMVSVCADSGLETAG